MGRNCIRKFTVLGCSRAAFTRGRSAWRVRTNPRLHTLSDEELMSRYAAGEEAAFEILLSRYTRPSTASFADTSGGRTGRRTCSRMSSTR